MRQPRLRAPVSVSLLLVAGAALGCEPGFPATPDDCRIVAMSDVIGLAGPPPTDVVISVDSSPSSAPFRARIAADAASIAARLVDRAIEVSDIGAIPELRISVVGGDLGCAGTPGELGTPRTRVSADAPAHCDETYTSAQTWPAQSREEIVRAVECLAWASDGCDVQRPLQAALAAAHRVSTGVRRPGAQLALYVVTVQDEAPGISFEELGRVALALGPWLDARVVAGIPADLAPIDDVATLDAARVDPRIVPGGVGCAIGGNDAPVAAHLLELVAELSPHVTNLGADSICTDDVRPALVSGVEGTVLSGICLPGVPAIDPDSGATECTLVEVPRPFGIVPPGCAARPGRHPEPVEIDAEGRESCEIVEVESSGGIGWRLGTFPEACWADGPALRFRVAFVPDATLHLHCLRYVSDRGACE